jgi:hypothetical protein
MPKGTRLCSSIALVLSLVLCAFQWSARFAFSADTSTLEDITVIKCEGIQYNGAQRIEFHYDRSRNELRLVGITSNNTLFVIARTRPEREAVGTIFDHRCDGDTVSITQRFPSKSVFITQVYIWDGKTIRQIKTEFTDQNAEIIDSAFEEALKGNLAEAISSLKGLNYPWNYFACDAIQQGLEKGHKASFRIQETKGFNQAATALENTFEFMSEVHEYCRTSEPETRVVGPKRWLETFAQCGIPKSKYVPALNDYGFFLQQAGKNGKAVQILSLVISEDPERTVAYLNLADAQWSLGKRLDSIKNYSRYNRMTVDSEKADKVPARVMERLKTTP